MRRIIQTIVAAGLIAFTASSRAVVYNVFGFGDDFPALLVPFTVGDPTAELNQSTVYQFLSIIGPQSGFPVPSPNVSDYTGGLIPADSYLVLFYEGITPPPGGINVFYFDAQESGFSIPPTGQGPAGTGPLGFAWLYGPEINVPVPDAGSTSGLLAVGLATVSLVRRRRPGSV